ncbi:MAG TPA: family 1 encapsulin nanocompartment shell protein [Anaeromyxobacter sp.]|nr:family 1 encapsulin nanocompartment shell protein [Anaeromyxobacter sp.]
MSWHDREGSPFPQDVWDVIDATVRAAAEEVRAARRVVEVVGPLGFAARAGVAEDRPARGEGPARGPEEAGSARRRGEGEARAILDEADVAPHVHVPAVQVMPVIHRTFSLGARAVEAFLARGEPLGSTEAAEAARQVARAEERLLVEGHAAAGVRGLLDQPGALQLRAGDWSDPGRAADELLAALAQLDAAGRHGPYAAAVSPARFYQLLRPHPASGVSPLEQLRPAFTGGIVKAPTLADGAIVVVRSGSGPRAIVGEELAAAYDGREGIFHRISLVESVTLQPGVPGSVAVLRG